MLTDKEQHDMYRMVKELYHHFGLDGKLPVSLMQMDREAAIFVAKWREKQAKKNERKTTQTKL